MRTGYLFDDLTASLIRGVLRVNGRSLLGEVVFMAWGPVVARGRFFPLARTQVDLLFYFAPSLTAYKAVVVLAVVVNVLLFSWLVRRVSHSEGLSMVTAGLMPALFQFRAYFDP